MERLWSPWRSDYVSSGGGGDGCVFCEHLAGGDDRGANILARSERIFVILNAFPYNTGHLMVAPQRHVGDLLELDEDEHAELFDVVTTAVALVRDVMKPDGFNVGANLGRAGGAGIPGHLHVHVVPRWGGDTNFMTTVGDTKVLPEMLSGTYVKLRPAFEERFGS